MRIRILVTVLATLFVAAASARAGLINGGFETGDLTGWTVFTTANGSIGGLGDVVEFDVDGDGVGLRSVRFRTGTAVYSPVPEGGGVFQDVLLGAGLLTVSADVAAFAMPGSVHNDNGGLFELLVDGAVVDSYNFGFILAGSTERFRLSFAAEVSAGLHEIRVTARRPFGQNASTPTQYIDDVSLAGTPFDAAPEPAEPLPEPGTLALLGAGLVGLARARSRRRMR